MLVVLIRANAVGPARVPHIVILTTNKCRQNFLCRSGGFNLQGCGAGPIHIRDFYKEPLERRPGSVVTSPLVSMGRNLVTDRVCCATEEKL